MSRSREIGVSSAEGRKAWLLFLAVAKVNANIALRGRFPTPEDMAAFAGIIVRTKAPFPVRRLPAEEVGVAALKIARALNEVAMPADRDELGELLLKALVFLERVIAEDMQAAVDLSRRIAGESGEDR